MRHITVHIGDYGLQMVGSADNDLHQAAAYAAQVKKEQAADKAKTAALVKKVNAGDPLVNYVFGMANRVLSLLSRLPQPARSYAVYQTYYETAAYSNAGTKQYNNLSGIKYAGQKNATKGPNGYAIFKTLDDWAAAFIHELTKGSNPAGAKNLEDYAHRLKLNGYYQDSESNYLSGLKRARLVLKVIPAEERAGVQADGKVQDPQDLDIPGTTDHTKDSPQWWKDIMALPTWGKVGLGALAILTVNKLVS